MDIKQKAVQQAIKMLEAVGAQYLIVTEDGQRFGEIVKKRRVNKGPSIFSEHRAKIAALKPGESAFIDCTNEQKDSMQTQASAFCGSRFGSGNYMTSRCERGIEVLILGDNRAPAEVPDGVLPFLQRKV